METRIVDPATLAGAYRDQVRTDIAALGARLRIVGLLSEEEGPAATYASYAQKGAEAVGVDFELRYVDRDQQAAVRAITDANADPLVHGIFLYYPLCDPGTDRWLRELVDPRKDIEGMHSFWSRLLYENRRFLDPAATQQAILPCTPLAIVKLLDHAGLLESARLPDAPEQAPLAGVTACVINRSDIVGRPLAAMLANDGAQVISLDLDGAVVFDPAIGQHAHVVRDSGLGRAEALARAQVVITGVPSRSFDLVRGDELRPGAICVNFSQFRNFDEDIVGTASAFVPRVGPMTVTMALRNLVRLARTVQVRG